MREWKECNITEVCDTISDTYKDCAPKVVLINTSDVLEGKITNHKFVDNKNLAGQFYAQKEVSPYFVMDIGANYDIGRLELSLNVHNLLNRHYSLSGACTGLIPQN